MKSGSADFQELLRQLKTPDARIPTPDELRYSTLSTPATHRRQDAACRLGKRGDPRAVEPLLEALKDWSDEVRTAAAWALCEIGDLRAYRPILDALRNETGHHSSNAIASSLLRLGHPDSVPSLLRNLRDEWCARAAVAGLEKVLTRSPERVRDDDLKAIAQVRNVTQIQGAWDYREMDQAERVDVDVTRLRQLAGEELERRTRSTS